MAPSSMPPSRVLRLLCLVALGRLATAQREKWCCKYKMLPVKGGGVVDPESGQLEQCEDGVMFIGGNVIRGREAPPLDDPHVRGLILTTVLTNGAYALPFTRAVRRGLTFEAVIAGATMVTSALYHLCESIERPVLGMNAGNWHRLDNVFAIMGFVALALFWADLRDPSWRDVVRWTLCSVTLFFQARARAMRGPPARRPARARARRARLASSPPARRCV